MSSELATSAVASWAVRHGVTAEIDEVRDEISARATIDGWTVVAAGHPGLFGWTRVEVTCADADDLELEVRAGRYLLALGRQDVEVGDAVFDADHVVRTADLGLARAWLQPEIRQAIAATLSPEGGASWRLTLGDGRCTLLRRGVERDVDRLEAAVRGAVEIADAPAVIAQPWRALASGLGGTWNGPRWGWRGEARFAIRIAGVEVTLDCALQVAIDADDAGPPRLRTVASARHPARSAPAKPSLWDTPLAPGSTPRALLIGPTLPRDARPGAARTHVHALDRDPRLLGYQLVGSAMAPQLPLDAMAYDILAADPAMMSWDGDRAVAWCEGLITDAPRLRALATLVAEVAAPPRSSTYVAAVSRPLAASTVQAAAQARGPTHGHVDTTELDGVAVTTKVHNAVPLIEWGAVDVEVAGEVPGSSGLTVHAHPGHVFLLRGLVQDLELGDANFDDRFVVRTDDVELARAWLSRDARAALLATYDAGALHPWQLDLAAGVVRLHRSGEPPTWAAVDAARHAVAVIAGRGRALARECRDVADDLNGRVRGATWSPDGSFALIVDRGGREVVVDFVRVLPGEAGGGRLRTRVRAHRGAITADVWALWRRDVPARWRPRHGRAVHAIGQLHAPWQGVASDPARAAAEVARLRGVIDGASAAVITAADEVAALLDGLVLDVAKLRVAIELVARLAEPTVALRQGPYR